MMVTTRRVLAATMVLAEIAVAVMILMAVVKTMAAGRCR